MSNSDIYIAQAPRQIARHPIRGIDYAVSEWGDPGDPLLIWLHGFGDCGATFQFVVDSLRQDWFVIAPDFRGFGDTQTTATTFWFPDYLADVDRLLDIYSPGAPARLIGHSMGANIGGLYAGAMPERVRGFVNVEGFGLNDADPSEAPARYRQWLEAIRASASFSRYESFTALAGRIRKRNPLTTSERAEFVARCWGRLLDQRLLDNGIELHADKHHKLPNPVLYRRAESEACWRNVHAPVLLVAGERSGYARAADSRLDVGSLDLPFPGATTQVIEAAGHMMHFEAPEALAAVIETFFGDSRAD